MTLQKRAFSTRHSEKGPIIAKFFHQQTNSFSYVVTDPATKDCVVIDPVLDFEQASGTISTSFAKQIVEYIKEHKLDTKWIFETHVHADHLTSKPHPIILNCSRSRLIIFQNAGAQYIKEKLGGAIAISEGVTSVQKHFKQVFNFKEFKADGSQFDHLIKNNDQFSFGKSWLLFFIYSSLYEFFIFAFQTNLTCTPFRKNESSGFTYSRPHTKLHYISYWRHDICRRHSLYGTFFSKLIVSYRVLIGFSFDK